jgi:hypothetical protein
MGTISSSSDISNSLELDGTLYKFASSELVSCDVSCLSIASLRNVICFHGILFSVSFFSVSRLEVSCSKFVVIPRTTEEILPWGTVSHVNSWKVLEYLAYESNSHLTRIEVDDMFHFSSVRSLFIPAMLDHVNGLYLWGGELSTVTVHPDNPHLVMLGFSRWIHD